MITLTEGAIFAAVGRPFTPPVVGSVVEGMPAEKAGLLPGDRILSIGGGRIDRFEEIQRAAFKPIKAGAMGGDIYAAGEMRLAQSKYHNNMHFLAHGMGLVSHEAPRLTATGPVPYDDFDAKRPLEAGMVISVETTLAHPKRGFVKLEDTAVVTASGCEIYGEGARGWNRGGTAGK